MKYLIGILLLLLNSQATHAQSKTDSGCAAYHKGSFTYTDSSGTVFTIKRKKHYQYDYDELRDVWVQSRIKWVSECKYQLYQVGSNSKSQRKFNHQVSTTIITRTINSNEYEYEFFCSCAGVTDSLKSKGIVKRIN